MFYVAQGYFKVLYRIRILLLSFQEKNQGNCQIVTLFRKRDTEEAAKLLHAEQKKLVLQEDKVRMTP